MVSQVFEDGTAQVLDRYRDVGGGTDKSTLGKGSSVGKSRRCGVDGAFVVGREG
jgi:hypothetical protein